MEIQELKTRPGLEQNSRLFKKYSRFDQLIKELKNRDIPGEIVASINEKINQLNTIPDLDKSLNSQTGKVYTSILKLIEKQLKIVPKNYYRNTWLAIGMAAFGIPFGVAFGTSLGNMAFLGIGIPIGMAIGIAIGTGMDKKAYEEGRQLEVEV